ncbi:MAG TPA: aldo/keto reductase [Jatrophihabitans sp.]|jgi:aryl-alcohol dehydrogenase-like predicted oxidoreductase|uniref:aldo/keto reductase n=1 Tax=Jatrophihabitans sp. TaxID=1932789 RepID=UPI002DFDFCB0|nr:aldo/keto reductase [Jatrophihabitans sp.]
MRYRTLGASGCAVSTLALGTMTFGAETDEAGSHEQLDRFVDAGGTLVDTADVYAGTESEAIIGRWLASADPAVRDRVVLATKARFPTTDEPNSAGLSRRHLSLALDASLRRLGVETIDLYQVHAWDPYTPVEETVRFMDDAVSAGKIRYFGLSNFTGWQLQKTVDVGLHRHQVTPVTLQPQYNLLAREIEWEIVPACAANGLGLLPWSPLGGGWLTGKYQRDARPTGATRLGENPERGVEAYDLRGADERTWDVVDTVQTIARERGCSMAQVALAWTQQRPAVTSVILGARTTEQLADNLGAADLVLDPEEMQRLDEASDPGVGQYPYGRLGREQRDRRISGGR